MPDLSPVAAAMTKLGFSVFPLLPNSKRPGVPWRSMSTTDTDMVLAAWPDEANIGVNCGESGLVVVDLDVHSANGVRAFTKLCELYEPDHDWPDTLIVATPSGGVHLYFEAVEGLGNGTGSLPAGIDIRGDGGYVVGHGSEIDGKEYRIHNFGGRVKPMPDWLVEIIRTPRRKDQLRKANGKLSRRMMSRREIEKSINGILDKLASTGEGDRNKVLYWAACRMFEFAVAGRIDEDTAESALLEAAEINGLAADDEYQVHATINSARRAVSA